MTPVNSIGIKVTFSENDSTKLIPFINITRGPLLKRRQQIRRAFVLAALDSKKVGDLINVQDISNIIFHMTKCKITDDEVIMVFDSLIKEKIIAHENSLNYKVINNHHREKNNEKIDNLWKDFLIFLKQKYQEYDPFLDKETKEIFDKIIMKLLQRFVISSDPMEKRIDSLPLENFDILTEEILKNTEISKDLKDKFPKVLKAYLLSNSPCLSKFIFENYYAIINFHLLRLEQQMKFDDFIKDINFLILDTQFIVSLLCKSDPLHPLTKSIVKLCSNYNILLYYTKATRQETWGYINGTKKEMNGFSNNTKHKTVSSQFVLDFIKQNIRWDDYITIIESWEIAIQKMGIHSFPKEEGNSVVSIDKKIFSYVKTTLPIFDSYRNESRLKKDPSYIHDFREIKQIEHDAFCLGLISYERSINKADANALPGPWFASYDTLVSLVDAAYRREQNMGLVIHPRSLFNFLLFYSTTEFNRENEQQVAEAIIIYTAGYTEEKLTLEEYSKIITSKLGLDEDNVEIVKRVLFSSPLRGEIERALRANRGEIAERLVYRVFTNDAIISKIINEADLLERLRDASKKLMESHKESIQDKAKIEELEKMVKTSHQIQIINNLDIDITTQNEISSLINLLKNNEAFSRGLIEDPPKEGNVDKLLSWLKKIKEIIENSREIGEGIKSLLPLIAYLVTKLGG